MGGYSTKRTMFLQILLVQLFISSSSSGEAVNSNEKGVCVSKGRGQYEFKRLNLCNVYHGKTCCSASRMLSASLALQNLATHGEASKDCLFWFELLECSTCHPDVGTQPRPLRICASFCDSVFEACSDAYFSSTDDAINQVIVPCGARNGTICEKASKLETNGTAFCEAVGFSVQTDDDSVQEPCYGSKSIIMTVVESLVKTLRFQDFNELVILNLHMCWSVSVFVLTITLLNMWVYHLEKMERDARR